MPIPFQSYINQGIIAFSHILTGRLLNTVYLRTMAAKYIPIIAVCLVVLQEGLSNTPAPTAGKAYQGQAESRYVKQVENDGDAAEVGHVAAVGLEKSGFRQRHIHTNSPYYGDAYRYHYPQQGYGNEYGQDYSLYAQSYGGNSPFGYYGQEQGRKF